jgi:hypothetical protein
MCDNSKFYKFSESGIKKRNPDLWKAINDHISIDYIKFKEKFYLYDNKIHNIPKCYCGNPVKFIDMKKGFREFCSKKCVYGSKKVKKKRKETSISRYGVDNPSKSSKVKNKVTETNKEKFGHDWATQNDKVLKSIKETNLKKYGVDNPSKLKEIREKAKSTMVDKYGVEYAMHSPIIKENLKEYFIEKFGVDNPLKVKKTRDKIKETMLNRYGVEYALQSKEVVEKLKETNKSKYNSDFYITSKDCRDKTRKHTNQKNKKIVDDKRYTLNDSSTREYDIKCSKCNDSFTIQRQLYRNRLKNDEEICLICNPISKNTSIAEKEILDYIKSIYKGIVLENNRINNKEIDIYLPELKLGFEYNGLYWHSELNKDKNYHLDKTEFFNNIGINLIQIWEDEWTSKKDIVKSMINNKLSRSNRIFARKCTVKEITDNKLAKQFIEDNHIQGFVGSKIKLGLFYNEELISIMTFGKVRKSLGQSNKGNNYELLRFCNKLGFTVVGGASKLFSYFKKNFVFDKLISYSLNSHSKGGVYSKMGFIIDGNSRPDYFWCKNGIRYHRFNFRKDKLVSQGEDINKTEKDIMYEKGYFRLFGCGSKKWIYESE